MPRVPTYDRPAVQQNAISAPRIQNNSSLETFGGGQLSENVTRSSQNLLDTAQKLYREEKRKAGQIIVNEKDNELSQFVTSTLYDPEKGVLGTRGKNALGVGGPTIQAFNKRVEELSQELNDDEQRNAFKQRAMQRGQALDLKLKTHILGQKKEYDNQVTKTFIENEQDWALNNFNNPGAIKGSIQRQVAAYKDFQKRNGLPPEWFEQQVSESVSKTQSMVISRMLANGQDIAANEYYSNVKDTISGKDKIQLEKVLEEGSLRGMSQRKADEISLKTQDRKEAMEMAKKIKDPKLRDETVRRVTNHFNQLKALEKERQDELYLKATNLIDENPNASARDIVSPDIWANLSLGQRNALENRAGNVTNDNKAWLDFLEMSEDKMSQLSRADFETKYWAKLDSQHRNRAESIWTSVKKAAEKGEKSPQHASTITFKDRLDNTLRTSGFIKADDTRKDMSKDELKLYMQMEEAGANAVEEFERTELGGKRKATGSEIQKVLDELVTNKVFYDPGFFSRAKEIPTAIIDDEQRKSAYIPIDKVPKADRAAIENLFRSKSKLVTEDKIERAYAAFKLNDKALLNKILEE